MRKTYTDVILTLAAKPRSELIELKGRIAEAYLKDDPRLNMSIDEVMHAQDIIDRELNGRAERGDLR